MNGRICVSIGKKSLREGLSQAESLATRADVIEIRLDLMHDPLVAPFLTIDRPLLFTNRPSWEGGGFSGDEAARLAPLLEAVRLEASYVDLELLSPPSSWESLLRQCGQGGTTRLICSWHNFTETPPYNDLLRLLEQMAACGAHIGKIVTMAHDFRDAMHVLRLQEHAAQLGFPLISFCMGEAGVISRVASTSLGGYMTYCAAERGEATAPGQITLDDLRAIYDLLHR